MKITTQNAGDVLKALGDKAVDCFLDKTDFDVRDWLDGDDLILQPHLASGYPCISASQAKSSRKASLLTMSLRSRLIFKCGCSTTEICEMHP